MKILGQANKDGRVLKATGSGNVFDLDNAIRPSVRIFSGTMVDLVDSGACCDAKEFIASSILAAPTLQEKIVFFKSYAMIDPESVCKSIF